MRSELFRREVLAKRRDRLEGRVIAVAPIKLQVVGLLIFALFGAAILYAATASFARTETVVGQVIPSGGVIAATPIRAGHLTKLYVTSGARVKAGDILAELSSDTVLASGTTRRDASLKSIDDQLKGLERQIGLEAERRESDLEALEAEKTSLKAEKTALLEQLALQTTITQSSKEAFDNIADLLDQGYSSKSDVEQRRQTWLSQDRITTQDSMRLPWIVISITSSDENEPSNGFGIE